MPNDRLTQTLHLHFIVIIFGFTAILGALISIEALPLVWYRMGLATVFVGLFALSFRKSLKVTLKQLLLFLGTGMLIALHWITFFHAIKVSSVSLTLSILSCGALLTAIFEPLFYKRKFIKYEFLFGVLVVLGLFIVLQTQWEYQEGILSAFCSIILSVIFTLINGKLVKEHSATKLSFYQLLGGTMLITVFLLLGQQFTPHFFQLSQNDWIWLLILALVCTAYAFIVSIRVMKIISPYSVMLAINMEPVYGIFLAALIFGENKTLSPAFYIGTALVVVSVVLNGVFKSKEDKRLSNKSTL